MDYEKEYKEALERAKFMTEHVDCGDENCFNVADISDLFPELAESEDEKIRKWLVDELYKPVNSSTNKGFDVTMGGKALAWLEKQGEKKSIWHNEDEEPQRGKLILLIMQSGTPIVAEIIEPNHTFNHGERWAYIDDLLEKKGETFTKKDVDDAYLKGICDTKQELEKQGEQKPTDKVEPKFRIGDVIEVKPMKCHGKIFIDKPNKIIDITEESYILDDGKAYSIELQDGWKLSEQKPAWSEEDENTINEVILNYKSTYIPPVDKRYNIINRLESLKDKVQPHSLTVTDEELAQAKKEAYNNVLDKIEYHSGEPTFDDGWSAAIWYLKKKNAQPQNTYKPSNEQMEALESAIENCAYSEYQNCLRELAGQLKKLRER